MQALKVIAEGMACSFRYPHFAQGVHITYEMPPPATLYGHLCGAVGAFYPPGNVRFAFEFTWQAKFVDYEHLHFFGAKPKMNPFNRELLYQPRLVFYLDNTELMGNFLSPQNAVVLGRSQDLMTYTDVSIVTLEQAERAWYGDTLISLDQARLLGGRSYAVTMPRFLGKERVPVWDQYAVLRGRVRYPGPDTGLRWVDAELPDIWIDPEPEARDAASGLQRGIIWHKWVA